MSYRCNNCDKPIGKDHILVAEVVDGGFFWVFRFCNWKCLVNYVIKNNMVEVVPA